jgi:hypothetical protein
MLHKFEHEIASQLTLQDIIDYKAFLELQRDNFVLDPEAEKKKKIKESVKKMIEADKQQSRKRRKR